MSCQSQISDTLISWNDGVMIVNLGYPASAGPRNVKKVVYMSENPCCENSALKLSVTNRTCVSYIMPVNHMGVFY